MRVKILLLLMAVLFGTHLFSQTTALIKGRVIDEKNDNPLSGANLLLVETNTGISSDINGEFVFKDLKAGTYHLKVQYLGYYDFSEKISLKAGEKKIVVIPMRLNIKELIGVEIRDDKIDNPPYAKVTIKKAKLDAAPVRDIGDFLRSIPNVGAVRKGGANLDPVIRGFKFDQLNVQIDNGISMEGGCPNRMDPTSSHVEAADIEAIEVLKGPFALRYGPNMGGVINMLTLNPRPFDGFQLHVKGNLGFESNWNGMRQHIAVLGGGKHVFFTFSGNNAQYGNYQTAEGQTVSSSFRKMGYTGKLGFSPAKNHIVTFGYSRFFARDVMFPALPMDERRDNTSLYSFDYKGKDISKTISTLDFKAYMSNVDHTMDNNQRSKSDTVSAISHIIARKIGYRLEAGLNVKDGHLFVGTDFYKIYKDGQRDKYMIGQLPKPDGSIPAKYEDLWNKAQITNFGLFAEYKRNIKDWELIGAFRFDYNSARSDSISLMNMMGVDLIGTPADSTLSAFPNFSVSLGATKNLNEHFSIGATLGRGVRSPGMIERFIISLPVGYDNFEYIGNPALKPEANNEFDLVFKYKKRNTGAFEFTLFYSVITDYISGVYIPKSQQKPLTAQVLGVKKFANIGTATMSGFEFGYSSPVQYKWLLDATAAYTRGSVNKVTVYEFDQSGNATGSKVINNDPVAEIPPLDLKINFGYKLLRDKLIPKLQLRYAAAQNRVSQANMEPVSPSFTLLNFSLYYKYNDYLDVSGGVNNMLNTNYTEHLNRRVLGTDYRIPEPGRIFYINLIFNL